MVREQEQVARSAVVGGEGLRQGTQGAARACGAAPSRCEVQDRRRWGTRWASPRTALTSLVSPLLATLLVWGVSPAAQAQVPPDPYSYSRASSFEYYGAADGAKAGLLKIERVEPGNGNQCVETLYDYDAGSIAV